MPGRPAILICHSPADKRWAERLQTALAVGKSADVLFWDGTNSRASADAPRTLEGALEAATHVVILVSARFLGTAAFRKARRPLLRAAEQGTRETAIILAGHCLWEATWLRDFPVIAGMNCPLDSLNASMRGALLEEIALRIMRQFEPPDGDAGGVTPEDAETPDAEAAAAPRTGAAGSPYARRLGAVIAFQKEIAGRLRRWHRMLLLVALGALIIAAFAGSQSAVLFFILAGFGLFAASLAFVVWARCSLVEQRIMSAQYIRTGFIDPTVPSRQRAALTRKADAILGQF